MKLLNMNKVLCLSPHPDDTEISVAGTILQCKDTHFVSVVCSIGSKGDITAHPDRFEECRAFWEDIKNIELKLLGKFLTDQTEDEWITLIEQIYKEDFEGILIPASLDSHQEHVLINRVGLALARNRRISILEYLSPSTLDSWHPNLFIDIKEAEHEKILRMQNIVSQDKKYLTRDYIKASHIHLQSYKKSCSPVEQFKILEHTV
jgi:LmbE family N-acetylglucosaminyl deacetylase